MPVHTIFLSNIYNIHNNADSVRICWEAQVSSAPSYFYREKARGIRDCNWQLQ